MAKQIDWSSVKRDYLATNESLRAIADRYGCSDTAIRKKAKKEAWGARNAAANKRAIVANRMSTSTSSDDGSHVSSEDVARTIEEAADQDIADMNLALTNARLILNKVNLVVAIAMDPKDLKSLSETNKINVEVIRRIRGLDEAESGWNYEEELERLTSDE